MHSFFVQPAEKGKEQKKEAKKTRGREIGHKSPISQPLQPLSKGSQKT
jgi:hypothetical protein